MEEITWRCADCGEGENEGRHNFCFACGAPRPLAQRANPAERVGANIYDVTPEDSRNVAESSAPPEPSRGEQGRRFKSPLSAIGHKLKRALPAAEDDEINHVTLSPEALERVDLLVQAGVFDGRPSAAAYLIESGIRAEAALFDAVRQKLSEIEGLREELRHLVRDSNDGDGRE